MLVKTHLALAISVFPWCLFYELDLTFSILKFLRLLPTSDLFSFVSSIPRLPLIVLVYTVFFNIPTLFCGPSECGRTQTHSHVGWGCLAVESDVRSLLMFVLALSYSPPSSTARIERSRRPQKHFPGLYRHQGVNRSKTWRLPWSCTTRCRGTTRHARPSSLLHKTSKSLWRCALHLQCITSYFSVVLCSLWP